MRAFILFLCLLEVKAFNISDSEDQTGEETWCTVNESGPVCVCCVMLKRVNHLKTLLHEKLSTLEAQYAQAQRDITKFVSHRTAFTFVIFNDHAFKCIGPVSSDQTIRYQRPLLNLGDAYDSQTGIFTVLYSGVYSMAITVFSDTGVLGSYKTCAHLRVNEKVMASSIDQHRADSEDNASFSLLMHLQAGDRVDVRISKGCMICDHSNYNSFTAFLLTADY
ncbi:cerebellin 20 [Synchiropus picturatus]